MFKSVRAMAVLGGLVALMFPHITHAGGGFGVGGGQAAGGVFIVHSRQFRVIGPNTTPAGLITIKFVMDGGIWTGLQLAAVKPGFTVAQLRSALMSGSDEATHRVSVALGGIGGRNETMVVNLPPGQYVLADTERGMKGKMLLRIRPFTVLGVSPAQSGGPRSTVTVIQIDFKFLMPASMPQGLDTFQVVNRGHQTHMMALFKLSPGKTIQDVLKFLKSQRHSSGPPPSGPPSVPPPGRPYGGFFDIDPGHSGWLQLSMTPGNYVALCFDTDPKTKLPHVALGMIKAFTVR